MIKILALCALLLCGVARALPVDPVDEIVEVPVAEVLQTSQAVAEQEPKISAVPKESDVDMSEQNKEAMENAETIGFGYHRMHVLHVHGPRVVIPPYPLKVHAAATTYGVGFPVIPSYGGIVLY